MYRYRPRSSVSAPLRLAWMASLGFAACGGAAGKPAPRPEDAPRVGSAEAAQPAPERSASTAVPPGPVRFSERIAPLAEQRCDGCHAKAPGGPMSAYRSARSFVMAGKPEQSPYFTLPKGHPPASWGDAADLVRAWIASGAIE